MTYRGAVRITALHLYSTRWQSLKTKGRLIKSKDKTRWRPHKWKLHIMDSLQIFDWMFFSFSLEWIDKAAFNLIGYSALNLLLIFFKSTQNDTKKQTLPTVRHWRKHHVCFFLLLMVLVFSKIWNHKLFV